MALIPINVAVGLVSAYNQNQAARRAQAEADRREREALAAEQRYQDSIQQDFNRKDADGFYDPSKREANARELFRQALDQSLGQASTEFTSRGFRAGDSLVGTRGRQIGEQSALGLANMIQQVRDESTTRRSSDLQGLNPVGRVSGLRQGAGYMSGRAQQMQVDPTQLLMSAFNTARSSDPTISTPRSGGYTNATIDETVGTDELRAYDPWKPRPSDPWEKYGGVTTRPRFSPR
jgi:hypothetical protein